MTATDPRIASVATPAESSHPRGDSVGPTDADVDRAARAIWALWQDEQPGAPEWSDADQLFARRLARGALLAVWPLGGESL